MKPDSRFNRAILKVTMALSAALALRSSAATHYVSQTSPNPGPPYSTPATAAHNIQDAVDAASGGDTVLVAAGDYRLTNQVTVTKAITVRSTMGPNQTILDAEANVWGANATMWCLWISNSLAVADGFTLSAGGVFSFGGTIQNCLFTNTPLSSPSSEPGLGTVAMVGGILSNSVVAYTLIPPGFYPIEVYCTGGGLVTDCQILGSGAGNGGPAVYLENSQMTDSLVTGGGPADDVASPGPAVSAIFSAITGCTIAHHRSTASGAGANLNNCLMHRCILAYNTCSGFTGGGIFESNSTIRDSLIVSNRATPPQPNSPAGLGGGVYMQGGGLVNCTVSGNSAADGDPSITYPGQGGGVYAEGGGITNCIVYGNHASEGSEWYNFGPVIFDHCCTAPDPGGAGNITQDPQFADMANGNYHLAASSSCIGAGVVQPWMTGAQNLDGSPRTVGHAVDMGVYQFRPPLSISRSGANITLVWPSAGSGGGVLEQSTDWGMQQNWATNTVTVTDNGSNRSVTIPATNNFQFFRLHLP